MNRTTARPPAVTALAAALLAGAAVAACGSDDGEVWQPYAGASSQSAKESTAEETKTTTEPSAEETAEETDEETAEETEAATTEPSAEDTGEDTGEDSGEEPSSDVDACYDADCTITVTESGTTIPFDPDLGVGVDSVTIYLEGDGVTVATDWGYTSGGEGSTGILNDLHYKIVSIEDGSAVIRFST